MPYLKLTSGQPETYSISQLRRDNPQVSFPRSLSDNILAEWGVYSYTIDPEPSFDNLTHRIQPAAFVQNEQGEWSRPWTVEQLSQADAERNVRNQRDNLLSSSDWTQMGDAPVDQAAWAAYRQALRDVPQQAGFPYTVTWPTAPE